MDKQTLRYTYLNYFKNQLDKNEPIDTKVLMDMAQNINDAAEVIKELKNDGLIEGISIIENDPNHVLMQSGHNVKLTEKGMNYLENKDKNKDAINASITYEQFLNNERDRISKLSTEAKKEEIKNKILLEYHRINNDLPIYDGNKIEESELKQKIKDIVKKYYPSTPQIIAKQITKDMCLQGYSNYIYSKNDDNKIPIIDLLTKKGKEKVEEVYGKILKKTLGELTAQEFYEVYGKPRISGLANIKMPSIFKDLHQAIGPIDNTAIKKLQQTINSYSLENYPHLKELQKSIQNINNSPLAKDYQNLQKQLECINQNPELQKIQKGLSQIMKEPPSGLYEEIIKDSDNKDKHTYTFEGILGQNCGEIEKYIDSSKQLQAKDFVVSRGIRVLRGYAKASDLYKASKTEYDYQRPINEPHIDSLKDFLLKMKDSAKYLPEVTLVARNDYKLEKFTLNVKSLSNTQKGIIDNLNYYKLDVQPNSLYRIDGNHRIEAANSIYLEYSKDLYLPFSIILWNPEDYYGDGSKVWKDMIADERKENEAFLFYFLNSKAKKLEVEENLQGIIKASRERWSDDDLKIANPNLSLMRLYQEQMQTQIYLNNELCKKDSLKQIAEILSKINNNNVETPIDIEKFKTILQRTNLILNTYKPSKLNNFYFYCQLVFYIVYMSDKDEDCIKNLKKLDTWVAKYKFDNSTFTDPILLYNNAIKSNYLQPINIFVAMPYDEENIENYTEWINFSITKLKEKNVQHSEQLNLNKIMPNRGYAVNLVEKIMDEINECDIFIADISPCIITIDGQEIKCDANPNVMYELGIAHNLKKPIILMREDSKFSKIPSDIQEKYRNTYKRTNTKKTQQTIQKALECVLEDFFD